MPKGARAGQSKGAQARMSVCMPNRGGTCPRERAQAKRRARAPNRWRTCPRERTHVVFHAKFGVSKGSAHVPEVARAGQICGAGRVQAQGGARMQIGGNACPRERAQVKRKARELG